MNAARPDRTCAPAARATLPRAARLLKATEFTHVFKRNQATGDALFRVLWRANDGPIDRLGMAVSRKVDRRAVGRNRIRRLVRERFRCWRVARSGAERHYDIVVMPRPRAAQAANAELARSLGRLWPAIGRSRDKEKN